MCWARLCHCKARLVRPGISEGSLASCHRTSLGDSMMILHNSQSECRSPSAYLLIYHHGFHARQHIGLWVFGARGGLVSGHRSHAGLACAGDLLRADGLPVGHYSCQSSVQTDGNVPRLTFRWGYLRIGVRRSLTNQVMADGQGICLSPLSRLWASRCRSMGRPTSIWALRMIRECYPVTGRFSMLTVQRFRPRHEHHVLPIGYPQGSTSCALGSLELTLAMCA